jgi:hypothetical protein
MIVKLNTTPATGGKSSSALFGLVIVAAVAFAAYKFIYEPWAAKRKLATNQPEQPTA